MGTVTKFDPRHCHKWAQLLLARQQKLNQALTAITENNFDLAKHLFSQIFNGVNGGKQAEPGMAGSLLYHMAMVTKMESETSMLLDELHIDVPDITIKVNKIYGDFESDAEELTKGITSLHLSAKEVSSTPHLGTNEKITLFKKLRKENEKVESLLSTKNPEASAKLRKLFVHWSKQILRMRLIQEYETI